MTREDIIAMAKKAGIEDEVLVPWAYEINMFSALVAAAAKAEEREACATIDFMNTVGLTHGQDFAVSEAIRERDNT